MGPCPEPGGQLSKARLLGLVVLDDQEGQVAEYGYPDFVIALCAQLLLADATLEPVLQPLLSWIGFQSAAEEVVAMLPHAPSYSGVVPDFAGSAY